MGFGSRDWRSGKAKVRSAAEFAMRPRSPPLGTSKLTEKTAPVMQAVRQIRTGLTREGFDATALIGFAGAPFTVACYMTEGIGLSGLCRDTHIGLAKSGSVRPDH